VTLLEGLPDLIKGLPWWTQLVVYAGIAGWAGWVKLRKRLRTADAAEVEKFRAQLAKEMEPYLKRLEHAERYAALLEKENGQLQDDLKASSDKAERQDRRIAQYLDDEVEAQKKMARVIGQCAELEKRVAQLETGNA
jgi:hypothetical protein